MLEHWRAQPASYAAFYDMPFLRPKWLDEVLAGPVRPPTTTAFLVNLVAVART